MVSSLAHLLIKDLGALNMLAIPCFHLTMLIPCTNGSVLCVSQDPAFMLERNVKPFKQVLCIERVILYDYMMGEDEGKSGYFQSVVHLPL